MKINKKTIKIISLADSKYPTDLKKIKNPPKQIFIKGEPPAQDEIRFAIVGTRNCSDYGKEAAFSIAHELSQAGIIIVSGMARGIDTFAHKGALQAKKRTIAVLGTGLDEKSIYPKENLKLAENIIKNNGCLISEYEPGTKGTKFTFPQRNRIIAGLSIGVLVVEAKQKSGALITADWATKQNKPIFAIPGSIFSKNSKGCHQLIKKGHYLVESADDIMKILKLKNKIPEKKENPLNFEGNEEERAILNVLTNGNMHIEKIIEATRLPASKVLAALSILEINNKVKNLGGNNYALLK